MDNGENKPKRSIWKWVVGVIVVMCIIGVAAGGGDDDSSSSSGSSKSGKASETTTKVEYTKVTAKQMINDLDTNALKAEKKYTDKYFEITGYIKNIDSDGSYIGIGKKDGFSLTIIMAYIQNDEQLDVIMDKSVGDKVVIKGKITDVGEVLGYAIDIDTIE